MNIANDSRSAVSAEHLRTTLIDRLRGHNILTRPDVEAVLRSVPRHLFVPDVDLERAYADDTVLTKTDVDGTPLSMASQPHIVAMMLEQLDVQPAQRVLEIGAGTGYNAALLARLTGDEGHVTTIDVDSDLVEGAREHLSSAEIRNVEVVLGDGAVGHHENAPYHRIIATVGAWAIPQAWLAQLAPGGRLVVPLRVAGGVTRSIVWIRVEHGWSSMDSQMCGFLPLRGGIGDDPRRTIALTPDGDVTLQVYHDQHAASGDLAGVLDTGSHEVWTDVSFGPGSSVEGLWLWLACRLDNALMRMNVQRAPVEGGLVTPMFRWGSMATARGRSLAYLTWRATGSSEDGTKRWQVGVVGNGPAGRGLAQEMAEEANVWNVQYRARPVRFEIPDVPTVTDLSAGRIVLDRPHHQLALIWE